MTMIEINRVDPAFVDQSAVVMCAGGWVKPVPNQSAGIGTAANRKEGP